MRFMPSLPTSSACGAFSTILMYEQLDVSTSVFQVAIDVAIIGNSSEPAISFVPSESGVAKMQPDSQNR